MATEVENIEIRFGTNADATARAVDNLKDRMDAVKKASESPLGGGLDKVTEVVSKMDILRDRLDGLIQKRDSMIENGGTLTGLANVSQQINDTAMQLEMLGEHVDDFTYSWAEQGKTFLETASKADILKGKMKDLKKEFYLKLETDSLTGGQAFGYAERYQRLREKYEREISAASVDQEKGGYTAQAMENVEALVSSLSKEELILQRIAALKREIATGVTNDTISDTSILSKTAQIQKLQEQLAKLRAESDSVDLKNVKKEADEAGKAAEKSSKGFSKLGSALGRILFYRVLRSVISGISNAAKEGYQNLIKYSNAINSADAAQAAATANAYATSLNQVKNAAASAMAPLLQAILPTIQTVTGWFIAGANAVNQFISALQGKSTYTKATGVAIDYAGSLGGIEDAASGASGAVKELQRTILGFDEINALNGNNAGGGGGVGGGAGGSSGVSASDMFEEVAIGEKFQKIADWIKDLNVDFGEILGMVKDVGVAFLGWKIASSFLTALSNIPPNLKKAWTEASTLQKVLAGGALLYIGIKWGIEAGRELGYSGEWSLSSATKTISSLIASTLGGAIIGGTLGGPTGLAIGAFAGLTVWVTTTIIGVIQGSKQRQIDDFYQTVLGQELGYISGQSKLVIDKSAEINVSVEEITGEISPEKLANLDLASKLIKEIYAIDSYDNLTSSEIELINQKIEILNSLGLDGVSLHFDEATGHVIETKNAIQQNMAELRNQYKLEALRESIIEAYKKQYEAETNLDNAAQAYSDALAARNKIENELKDTVEKRGETYKRMKELEDAGKQNTEEYSRLMKEYNEQTEAANILQGEYSVKVSEANKVVSEAKEALDDAGEAAGNARVKVDDLENALEGYVNATEESKRITTDFGQKAAKTYDDIQREAMETAGAYEDLEASAKTHLGAVIKKTDEAKTETHTKVESMKKDYNSLGLVIDGVTRKVSSLIDEIKRRAKIDIEVRSGGSAGTRTGGKFAEGGFPQSGSFFWAGENNQPELLGTIGGKSAVASGREITGITAAVNESSAREALLLNKLIEAVLSTGGDDGNGGITTTELLSAMKRQNRRDGATTFAV